MKETERMTDTGWKDDTIIKYIYGKGGFKGGGHTGWTGRFNKIVIQPTAQMAVDMENVGLSRVHMYESKCILPLRDNYILCS